MKKLFSKITIFVFIEWMGREGTFAIANNCIKCKKPIRWGFYYILIILIFIFSGNEQQFIYFQF